VVVILGPSGSGKTTLLRSINFLEPADSGTIELDGETIEIAKATKQDIQGIRKHTGFVFQNYNLFANKTAEQNITEGLIYGLGLSKNAAKTIAQDVLEKSVCVSLRIIIRASYLVGSSNVSVLLALSQLNLKYYCLMSQRVRLTQNLLVIF
jgi:ABC-type polar amino acid transport system ATPase subunit